MSYKNYRLFTCLKFSIAQETRLPICGMRLFPVSVSEYSTFGGTSAYTLRFIKPSASKFFKVSVSTLGEMSGMALPMALKRVALFSESTHSTSIAHLPEKRAMTFRIGQVSMRVYFFRFSCNSNAFIHYFTYVRVSILHLCNFLFIKFSIPYFALIKRKGLPFAKLIIKTKMP